MFPAFSKSVAANDMKQFKSSVSKSIDVVSFTMLPCTAFAILFSKEIISLLFGRGAFDVIAIENSAEAMKFYSVGLLCLSFNAIFSRAFYALKKVKIVSFVACGTLVTNVTMNFLLKPIMGIGGLALATSISNTVASIILVLLLSKEVGGHIIFGVIKELSKIAIATAALAVVSYFVYHSLSLRSIESMGIAVVAGSVVYLGITYLTNCIIVKDAVHKFTKKNEASE